MLRRIRLGAGLVLFIFVSSHLINHALGLASLQLLADARDVFVAVWRSWPGIILLYGALLTHLVLVLWALYSRRSLRVRPREGVQILFGLALPFLLVDHVLSTRGLNIFFGVEDNYIYEILVLWLFAPDAGILQIIVLGVAWIHGCIGLHFWLKLKPWYAKYAPYLQILAVLLPVSSAFGFVAAGREIKLLWKVRRWRNEVMPEINWPEAAALEWVDERNIAVWIAAGGVLGAVLLARLVRRAIVLRRGVVRLTYGDGRVVEIRPGISVLEASRNAGIPHASVCGGRGRCSTCRVRLGEGREHVAAADAAERKVLKRVGLPEGVRLACQLRPTHDLAVTPLLPPDVSVKEAFQKSAHLRGSEREVAILFVDIRAFTSFSETKLPYDVVFVLNRYFQSMGEAVHQAGGILDKFIGDGAMAIFGNDCAPEEACRRALAAARNIAAALDQLNASLQNDLPEPLRIGIGIHLGTVIVGEMGWAQATSFTAIGDAVNTASRLEQATKQFGCQLVVSQQLAERAGMDLGHHPLHDLKVRGRVEPVKVRAVPSALDLAAESSPL
ncbi:MAG: adenylate/guanylate cyclase domain-containing protein [Rhodospirillales bacterium]|jgi:adenylate cyclase|nr:adenylate/guanylate cyclase domain-containing protein [Rhodospirillales bacterium]MDP6590980.1 adenylate/guanylate cyclase domain-containing protein [Alphaproteobacteria bacterium]MDP6842952.1 adenylate/guanylate cyclase domain-containing protein [Rhodospirillales bacterium]